MLATPQAANKHTRTHTHTRIDSLPQCVASATHKRDSFRPEHYVNTKTPTHAKSWARAELSFCVCQLRGQKPPLRRAAKLVARLKVLRQPSSQVPIYTIIYTDVYICMQYTHPTAHTGRAGAIFQTRLAIDSWRAAQLTLQREQTESNADHEAKCPMASEMLAAYILLYSVQ